MSGKCALCRQALPPELADIEDAVGQIICDRCALGFISLARSQVIERQHEADWLRDEPCSEVKH